MQSPLGLFACRAGYDMICQSLAHSHTCELELAELTKSAQTRRGVQQRGRTREGSSSEPGALTCAWPCLSFRRSVGAACVALRCCGLMGVLASLPFTCSP